MKKYDVTAIGSGNIDLILSVPSAPEKGGKIVGKQLGRQVGGTVANSACVMGRLGLNVTSASCVGDDSNGQDILNDFKKFNVDCNFVSQIPGHKANIAVIFIDDTGEKSLIYAPGDSREWDDDYADQAISQSRYLYTMPSDVQKFKRLADCAHQSNTKVVVDIEPHIASSQEVLNTILSLSDVVIFNQAGFIAGYDLKPSLEKLKDLQKRYDLDALVVTLDADGVMAVTEHESERFDIYNVPVVDTTGAGDTFNGAFVYSLVKNKSLKTALQFASATAAISITALGAKGNLPTAEEVNNFIVNYQ